MKKATQLRKLPLRKETVRALAEIDLGAVIGGQNRPKNFPTTITTILLSITNICA